MLPAFQRALGELPFIWDYQHQDNEDTELPERMAFVVGSDPNSGALVQVANAEVREALRLAYIAGSVLAGVATPANSDSDKYIEAFWEFVNPRLGSNLRDARCLEIGSGHGGLLSRLHRAGAMVTGVEPGLHGQEFAQRTGLRVIREFFPTPQLEGRFDAIFACHVLEHVEDARTFLLSASGMLEAGGQLFLAIPDCTECIASGDPSMFVHEHFHYHTRDSLSQLLQNCGMVDIEIVAAEFGGSLYARCRPGSYVPGPSATSSAVFETFSTALDRAVEHAKRYFHAAFARGEQIGFYMPMRALNLLTLTAAPARQLRFFDDDPNLQGKRLAGFPVRVESRAQLLASPPPHVIIMSHTFGEKVRTVLVREMPGTTSIRLWKEIIR